MNVERWRRLSQVYYEALQKEGEERAAFLEEISRDDTSLRAELESLLQYEHAWLSTPALDVTAMAVALSHARAPIGARLGPYRIDALIGEGGMGQVYRAHDTDLGRDVAIKVLPPLFALDANRRERFEREARVLASLSHPHIGAIFGLAEGAGLRGLVLELVEGDTLAERLHQTGTGRKSGGLPTKDALTYAFQIAQALDAAHEKGIVHRDLKPANIKITAEGTVKVLDFGLARATDDLDERVDTTGADVTPASITGAGAILGTAAYMSPEQVQGLRVDRRADVWAFGCVLYEMLTGRALFVRSAVPETFAAIVGENADLTSVPVNSPRVVELLRRCLEREPKRRLRDIGEAVIALEEVLAAPPPAPMPAGTVRNRRPPWRLIAVIAVTTGVAAFAGWNLKPASRAISPQVLRLAIPVGPGQRPAALKGLALSPDGTRLAYVAEQEGTFRLGVRSLDSAETRVLPGTERAAYPFFSSDAQWIGFFVPGALKKVPVAGGVVETVVTLAWAGRGGSGVGAVWAADGTIFFANAGEIWRVPAAGGTPSRVSVLERAKGEIIHQAPSLLPDGRTLLYTVWRGPGWDEKQIVAQRLDSTTKHVLVSGAGTAIYTRTGHLVYTRAGALMGVRFDASRLQTVGAPAMLLNDVREGTPAADYAVSPDGSLAYVQQPMDAYDRFPVIVDRHGHPQRLPGLPPAYYQSPTFSPDGQQLALMVTGPTIDIVLYHFARASVTRLTTEGSSQYPVWSSDGTRIAYRATRSGSRNLFWRPADGGAGESRLTTSESVQTPWSSSADGQTLAFDQLAQESGLDVWVLPLEGDRVPRPLLHERFNESRPRFSPDGRWLAFVSDRSGRSEVYVQSYPEWTGRLQVSTDGGDDPVWSGSGRELFYRLGAKVMSVSIDGDKSVSASRPRLLFEGNYIFGEPTLDLAVDPNGDRFVLLQSARPDTPVSNIAIVVNWTEELKQRVPAR